MHEILAFIAWANEVQAWGQVRRLPNLPNSNAAKINIPRDVDVTLLKDPAQRFSLSRLHARRHLIFTLRSAPLGVKPARVIKTPGQ